MGKVLPSQRLLKQFEERLVFGEMNLSEIVRSGAQMMLQYALEREVTEALGRSYYENAPEMTKEKGRRNGYESHRVLTGEGPVTVQVPQVRETETGFQSKILDAYVSRTEKLDELIARMYVHGMSTRDIEATFADVLSGTGVSKSVVSRVTRCLSEDFEAFRKRDLSNEELLYLELDGTYLRYHQGAEKKEPILVATGYRVDGTRVLLHIGVGNRESYENWKGFLQEMVARGRRCCTARSKSLTSLCRLQSHPAQYVSGIPSAAILLSISHPIRCSTRCLANVRARISGPMIAL